MTHRPHTSALFLTLALGATACGDAFLEPAAFAEVRVVTRDHASVGDTVDLTGVVTNRSDEMIRASGMGCAPGIGFVVTDPSGAEVNLYAGLDFLCPQLDSHELLPGETDAVTWSWVPTVEGRHTVRSVLLTTEGPWRFSPPATVGVHPR